MDGPSLIPKYHIIQLKEGYRRIDNEGNLRTASSISLVKGPFNVLIGTGLPQDKDFLIESLERHCLKSNDIRYVICTDAHIENVGNLNLFSDAVHIIGSSIMKHDISIRHDFEKGRSFEIEEDLDVIFSPGMTHSVIALMVSNSNLGIVAIAGGTFHSEADLENPDLWIEQSHDPDQQLQSRIDILKEAQFVIPRYGALFEIPQSYKGEMQIVMTST